MEVLTNFCLTVPYSCRALTLFAMGVSADVEYANDMNYKIHKEDNEFNASESEKQRLYETEMWERTNQWNEDMWNKNNAYNEEMYNKYSSPQAQVQQLREAGLNPNLFSNGNVAQYGSAQAMGGAGVPIGSAASSSPSPIMQAGGNFLKTLKFIDSQIDGGSTLLNSFFDVGTKRANTRLTNALAKQKEIENKKTETEDSTLGASGFYMNSDGDVVTKAEYDTLDPDEKIEYMPLTSNSRSNDGTPGSNLGSIAALERLNKIHGDRSDVALKTMQNEFNSKIFASQITDDEVMRALKDMPVAQYKNLIEEVAKAESEIQWNGQQIEESKANTEFINKQSENLQNSGFGKALDQLNANFTVSNFLKAVIEAWHGAGGSIGVGVGYHRK